jgi:HAD superfamily phosphoserine phosphatase-like hydrolase
MRVESIARVMERIEVAGIHGEAVVTTDADGTLWSGDVGVDVFEALLESKGVREEARDALVREAHWASISSEGDIHEVAGRLWESTIAGGYPEDRCYEMMAWAFAGWSVDEALEFARGVRERRGLRDRLHAEMSTMVRWIRERGVELWVVSASPVFMVQAGVELLGIEADKVIAASPEVREGRLAPCMAAPIPYGHGKVRGIERAVGDREVVAAFGDEVFDLEMLTRARVPVAVRPKPRLRIRAAELPSLVELGKD